MIDLSADAGGSDDPLVPQLGENRIGLLDRLLDVAHAARKLDDVVDVGDVDALEPEALSAFDQRLPCRRRAIIIDAAQRAGRPTLRKVDGFSEGIFWRVPSQQSADFRRDDVVAAIVFGERPAKPDFRGPETVIRRRVETSHARRPSRLDDFAPRVVLVQGAEETGAEPEARDLQLRLAYCGLVGGIHCVTFELISRARPTARAELGQHDRDEKHCAVEDGLGVR